jgi:hypothetical protein
VILQDPPRKSQASIAVCGRRVDDYQSLLLPSTAYFNWTDRKVKSLSLVSPSCAYSGTVLLSSCTSHNSRRQHAPTQIDNAANSTTVVPHASNSTGPIFSAVYLFPRRTPRSPCLGGLTGESFLVSPLLLLDAPGAPDGENCLLRNMTMHKICCIAQLFATQVTATRRHGTYSHPR